MADAGRTPSELFISAQKKQEALQLEDPRSDVYKGTLVEAIFELQICLGILAQNGVFSPNEELDDISTQDLPLLSVEYLLANLITTSYDGDRLQTLRRARDLYDRFLTRLDQYGILSSTDQKLFERFQEDKAAFTLAAASNFEERRKVKISRFQEEKSLKAKLEYLSAESSTKPADDETLRKLHLAQIALYASQTFQLIDMITQESAILSQARFDEPQQPRGPDERQASNGPAADGYSDRLDGPLTRAGGTGALLDQKGKPLRPFTLTEKRTQVRQGVFRPGHNLPTMSIDEYLEEEKRRGGILDSSTGSATQAVGFDEDNMAHVDAETMKAREWDEFVEANPKGAGNTLNRG